MENNFQRKQELAEKLNRNGVMLDGSYIQRAKELYNAAAAAAYEAEQVPFYTEEEVEDDLDAAYAARPRDGAVTKIVYLSCFALAVLSLLLPLKPFLARSPICGAFLGIGGIVFFSYLLGAKKREKRALEYQKILDKYGVKDMDEIPQVQEQGQAVRDYAAGAMETLRSFLQFADPNAQTPGECAAVIREYDALVKEYNSL